MSMPTSWSVWVWHIRDSLKPRPSTKQSRALAYSDWEDQPGTPHPDGLPDHIASKSSAGHDIVITLIPWQEHCPVISDTRVHLLSDTDGQGTEDERPKNTKLDLFCFHGKLLATYFLQLWTKKDPPGRSWVGTDKRLHWLEWAAWTRLRFVAVSLFPIYSTGNLGQPLQN